MVAWSFSASASSSPQIFVRFARARRWAKDAGENARRLEAYHVMQREFISMVSHEFRTPLAVIDATANNLTEVPPQDDADLQMRAKQVLRAMRFVDGRGQPLQGDWKSFDHFA